MENLGYLLAIFIIVWVVLFGYIFILSQRQRQLRRDIKLLDKIVTERKNDSDTSSV